MKKLLFLFLAVCCNYVNAQYIKTIAGTGVTGTSGDGGPAINSQFWNVKRVVLDRRGNVYVAEDVNRIRKISTNGIISTFAGTLNTSGYSGDGGPATSAHMTYVAGMAFDSKDNLFFIDQQNWVIRKIDTAGIITTVYGNGIEGFSGDGGPAINASFDWSNYLAFDHKDNLYLCDANGRIRKIDTSGIITTVVGNGTNQNNGNEQPAINAGIGQANVVAFDKYDNMYLVDAPMDIRKVDSAGIIHAFAGYGYWDTTTGNYGGYAGDGGPATSAIFYAPTDLLFDKDGNLLVADAGNSRIRMIDKSGIINTIAGTGIAGYNGDSLSALLTQLNGAGSMVLDSMGNLYFCDGANNRVRVMSRGPLIHLNSAGICLGDTATLTATGNSTTYSWSPSPTLLVDTGAVVKVNPSVTSTYTVTGALTQTVCNIPINSVGSKTVTVSLSTLGVNATTICIGGTGTLTASGMDTYSWNTGDTTAVITASPTVTTNYTVTGIDTNNCVLTDTTTITVNTSGTPAAPVLSASNFNPMILCQSSGVTTYTVTPDTGSVAVWYVSGDQMFVGNVYSAADSMAGTIMFTVIDSSLTSGCTSASVGAVLTVTLSVNPLPGVPIVSSPTVTYCQGSTFSPISASGTGVILWSDTSTMNPVVYTGNAFTPPSALPLGTKIYYLRDSSITTGCVSTIPDSVVVNVVNDSLPSVTLQIFPDSIPHVWDVYISYSANVVNATWYWGDGHDTTALYPYHAYDSAGMYTICITVFNACGDSASVCRNDSLYFLPSNLGSAVAVHTFQSVTGIKQNIHPIEMASIYPNPARESFTIETGSTDRKTMEIFDLNGKLLLKQNVYNKTTIPADILPEGIYQVSVTGKQGVVNKKLVIVR